MPDRIDEQTLVANPSHNQFGVGRGYLGHRSLPSPIPVQRRVDRHDREPPGGPQHPRSPDVLGLPAVALAVPGDDHRTGLCGQVGIGEHLIARRTGQPPCLQPEASLDISGDHLGRITRIDGEIEPGHASSTRTSSLRTEPPSEAAAGPQARSIVEGWPTSSPWWTMRRPTGSPS